MWLEIEIKSFIFGDIANKAARSAESAFPHILVT